MAAQSFLNKTKQAGRKGFLYLRAQLVHFSGGPDGLDGDAFALLVAGAMAFGAAIYFALPFEPAGWGVPVLGLSGFLLVLLMLRKGGGWWRCGWLIGALITGLMIAQIHVFVHDEQNRALPPLPTGEVVTVRGRIDNITQRSDGQMLTLKEVQIKGASGDIEAGGLRLYWRATGADSDKAVFRPGDVIAGKAELMATEGPFYPGGYDPRLNDFFDDVVGRGYLMGMPLLLDEQQGGFGQRLATLRQHIEQRLLHFLPESIGSIATALITGNQSTISKNDMVMIRNSGLAHLLSISGLHMTLVAGFFLVLLRRGLLALHLLAPRLCPAAVPIRKIAALGAMLAAGCYLMLSGASVPAVRACIALLLVMVGILMDRDVVNFRMLAVAMIAVLLMAPAQVRNPGALMSFLSVAALVGFYRWWPHSAARNTLADVWLPPGFAGRAIMVLVELALTSVIAGLATWPIALAWFGTSANYAVLSNMIAVPVAGFWVMPLGVAGLLAMPFGLEGLFWSLMGLGIDVILWIAGVVADLPGAVMTGRTFPGLLAGGVAVLVLMLSLGRVMLGIALAIGVVLMGILLALPPPPVIFVDMRARAFGVLREHTLLISDRKTTSRRTRAWQQATAAQRIATMRQAIKTKTILCDAEGCLMHGDWGVMAMATPDGVYMGAPSDCTAIDFILVFDSAGACPEQDLIAMIKQSSGWHQNAISAIAFDRHQTPVFAHTPMPRRPWERGREQNDQGRGGS